MSGHGYVISFDVVKFIALQRNPPLKALFNEDVSVGMWLSSLSINRIDVSKWYDPNSEKTKPHKTIFNHFKEPESFEEFYTEQTSICKNPPLSENLS
jgi:hypothetical protein